MANQFRIVVGIGFLMILGYSALWFTVAFDFEKQAAINLSGLRELGINVTYDDISLGGFPYRITIEVSDLTISDPYEGYEYTSDKTEIVTHLWTPQHYVLQAENINASFFNEQIKIEDNYARASLRYTEDSKIIIAADSYTTDDLKITQAPDLLRATEFNEWQIFLRLHEKPEAPISGLYEDRFMDFKIVLNGKKGDLEAIGGISGQPILSWNQKDLTIWRNAGGLLEFDALTLSLGGAKLEGTGSFTLDDQLKLLGSIGFKTRRNLTDQHIARLNRFLKANKINSYQATAQSLQTPVGLSFQNGQIAIGNEKLLTIGSVLD
ncbi:DUF2125 domain-containing protein [Kordiimonas sp. SCSIO 12610]|uniref:DUF2125 domain-containing protein n=1 Tax=Kordiimonas sp. SCSIO 12610 TaxID=2829597 RepID=UPI002109E565|nr:DUF2125 domain-containing protein [Kordiimonas sp. SCSIO 12610]UTW55152.1 DUF2125 domain-containing protein [Kordiimonas sp. SCSIO 12610]